MPSSSTPSDAPTHADPALVLPASTAMDAVTLHVGDLAGMSAYYRDALGLEEVAGQPSQLAQPLPRADRVVLGRGGRALVVLVHTPGLPPSHRGQAGLFHTALLFEDRAELAATLARAAQHPGSRYVGSADHLVSDAFYFTDPEGNGIELYWDHPQDAWAWRDGKIEMGSLPLDPNAFLREHLAAPPQTTAAQVGHVHLKVGDIARARSFYVDALGFEVTADLGTALFVSAGGYHHHLGMNTWTSAGAGPRAATIGLGQVAITVPGREGLDALAVRLREHGTAFTDDGRTLSFEDPWRSLLQVSAG